MSRILSTLVAIVLFLFAMGFAIGTVLVPPSNAEVWANDDRKEFITPPFRRNNRSLAPLFSRATTYGEVMALKYTPEATCNREPCWAQDGRTLSGKLLQAVGVLGPVRTRWNPDGSWNW
jgi:hypothetical protein